MVVGVPVVTHLLFLAAFSYTGYPRLRQGFVDAYLPFHPARSVVSSRPVASSTSQVS